METEGNVGGEGGVLSDGGEVFAGMSAAVFVGGKEASEMGVSGALIEGQDRR